MPPGDRLWRRSVIFVVHYNATIQLAFTSFVTVAKICGNDISSVATKYGVIA